MLNTFPGQVSASVYQLGNYYFRTYLVCGECCALVEGGVTSSATQVIRQIAELGIEPERIQYLVIMHAHHDHMCGVPILQKAFPNLKILASASAAKVLAKEKVVRGFYLEDRPIAEILNQKGIAEDVIELEDLPATIKVDAIIKEGDTLKLGPATTLQFQLAPGHSPCSIAAYFLEEQVLFPTDCAGYPVAKDHVWSVYFYDYHAYLTSLARLLTFEVAVLAAPHDLVLMGKEIVHQHLQLALESAQKQNAAIIADYQSGKTPEEISMEMYHRIFKAGLTNYSVKTIKGCIDLLVRRSLETAGIEWKAS